jgi:excisionase family DNA binding protein
MKIEHDESVVVPIEAKVLLTTAEAAALLGMSERTLHTLSKAGRVPCVRIPVQKGKRALVRYRRAALENWALEQERDQSLPSDEDPGDGGDDLEDFLPDDLLE